MQLNPLIDGAAFLPLVRTELAPKSPDQMAANPFAIGGTCKPSKINYVAKTAKASNSTRTMTGLLTRQTNITFGFCAMLTPAFRSVWVAALSAMTWKTA